MPGPVSRTDTWNAPLFASALMATSPASANLIALPTRLISTCVKRRPSPCPGGSSRASSSLNASFLSAASGSSVLRTVCAISWMQYSDSSSSSWPASILDRSSTSLMSPSRCLPLASRRLSMPSIFSDGTVSTVRHYFGIAQDGVERRAELMAHIRGELRLVLTGELELLALILDFVEQAHVFDSNRNP